MASAPGSSDRRNAFRLFFLELDPELDYGLLPSLFYRHFREELPNALRFMDEIGNDTEVNLDKSFRFRFLTVGYHYLVQLYGFNGAGWIKVLYVSNGHFHVMAIEAVRPPSDPAQVEVENRDSWIFFLQLLDSMIGSSIHDKSFVIMTDRQKVILDYFTTSSIAICCYGLILNGCHLGFFFFFFTMHGLDQVINEVFPTAQHRWCCRYLYANFKERFPGMMLQSLFWKAARSYCNWEFIAAMELINQQDHKAFEWLDKIPTQMWSRQAFDPRVKSDHITNNMSESFNHLVGPLRDKLVMTLVELLVVKLMGKIQTSYSDVCSWDNNLTPRALKKVEWMKNMTNRCSLVPAGQMDFVVTNNGKRFPVNLNKGLPCKHALTCITDLWLQLEQFCDHHFSKNCYQLAYSDIIHPIPNLSMVVFHENAEDVVLPPPLRRLPGRPRKNRRREVGEGAAGPGIARRSSTVKCDTCKQFGHKKRTCQRDIIAATKTGIKSKKRKIQGAVKRAQSSQLVVNAVISTPIGTLASTNLTSLGTSSAAIQAPVETSSSITNVAPPVTATTLGNSSYA